MNNIALLEKHRRIDSNCQVKVQGRSKNLKRIDDYNLQVMQLRLQKEADEKAEDNSR
jgi:hypothetical protein